MPNLLSAAGLLTATRQELVDYFTAQYKAIYGNDIILISDSPDGQMMNIYIQALLDDQDLLTQIYNSFDPDNAIGVVLDQRVAINGVLRQAGTYTLTDITIVTSQSVNLYGLEQSAQEVYTVKDNAGNKWFLLHSVSPAAGTHSYSFRAAVPGAQLTIPNTINSPVTIVLGVTSVNNPTTYSTLGINEESDPNLKLRRQRSVSISSQGYLAGLLAALQNIPGVTTASVYENNTAGTNGDGVPSHSIWVVVGGTGASADIANAIYTKRNAGCGMYGQISYGVTQVDGSFFTVYWDIVETRPIFIFITATSIDGITPPNVSGIRTGLPLKLVPQVNEAININEIATIAQELDPNALITGASLSTGLTTVFNLSGVPASGAFYIEYNGHLSVAIAWNAVASDIKAAIAGIPSSDQAPGTPLVLGSPIAQQFTVTLSPNNSVLGLLTVQNNTLQTAGAVPVTFTLTQSNQNVLAPPTKQDQFTLSSANIVVLPILLVPTTVSVHANGGNNQFNAYGGYGPYVYTIPVDNSGGTIDVNTGYYTSGLTSGVNDTIKVTDFFGNFATATVTVI